MDNRFSVLMSVYFKEKPKFLDMSLSSIIDDQRLKPDEVVLICDGPLTPELDAVINKYEDAYKDIFKVYHLEKNGGLAAALNFGIGKCSHDLIARADSDDLCVEDRFEKQIAYMETHIDVDCLGAFAKEIDLEGNLLFEKKMPLTHEECLERMKKTSCMIHPVVMFRKRFFEKSGLYPTDTICLEDLILWARGFAAGCRFANIPEYLLYFRVDEKTYARRGGWKYSKYRFVQSCKINKILHLGIMSYIYAFAAFIMRLLPTSFMKFFYSKFR